MGRGWVGVGLGLGFAWACLVVGFGLAWGWLGVGLGLGLGWGWVGVGLGWGWVGLGLGLVRHVCLLPAADPRKKSTQFVYVYVCVFRWKRPSPKNISPGGHRFSDVCGNAQAKYQECHGRTTFQMFSSLFAQNLPESSWWGDVFLMCFRGTGAKEEWGS